MRIGLSFVILYSLSLSAAIPKSLQMVSINHKESHYVEQGVWVGGEDKAKLGLLDIARKDLSLSEHRLIFSFADQDMVKTYEKIGYFHISVHQNPKRIVMDFQKVIASAVDLRRLNAVVGELKFIKSTEMSIDPEDQSLNVTLNLNQMVKVEAFRKDSDDNSAPQLILDMQVVK